MTSFKIVYLNKTFERKKLQKTKLWADRNYSYFSESSKRKDQLLFGAKIVNLHAAVFVKHSGLIFGHNQKLRNRAKAFVFLKFIENRFAMNETAVYERLRGEYDLLKGQYDSDTENLNQVREIFLSFGHKFRVLRKILCK